MSVQHETRQRSRIAQSASSFPVLLLAGLGACIGDVDYMGTDHDSSGGAPNIELPVTCTGMEDNAPPAVHRLNQLHYANTVRAVLELGPDIDPASGFPTDPYVASFSNNAGALTVSTSHIERFDEQAQSLARQALAPDSPTRGSILTCDGHSNVDACAEEVVRGFLSRAWRRPAEPEDIQAYTNLLRVPIEHGDGFEHGVELMIHAALLSPNFTMHVERSPNPDSNERHSLSGHELANRLSYFLWNAPPDAELTRAADAGELANEAGLLSQVDRMLALPEAAALTNTMAAQWLSVENLDFGNVPSADFFPEYTAELKASMETETLLFMAEFIHGGRPLSELLTSRETYVNGLLAAHYGIGGVTGPDYQRITLPEERMGILGQGSILTITSGPDRTSPVKRGVWVLTNILCQEPEPPPAGVETDLQETDEPMTLRERLEEHRRNPICASCHDVMDPPGLALEHFDAIGRYREIEENGISIEASGEIIREDGNVPFDDHIGMAHALGSDPRFSTCVVERILTYALRRQPVRDDHCRIEAMAQELVSEGMQASDAIRRIVASDLFRERRPNN